MNENIQVTDAQMAEATAVLAADAVKAEASTTEFVQTDEETGANDAPVTVH